MLIVFESGKWCGPYSVGLLWAPSENELAAAATMLQAVGLGGRGRRVHPQSRFSLQAHFGFTELTGGSQGTLSRTCKHTLPGSLWVSNLFCSWGHTGTPVSQTGRAEWAQAVWYPPEQNKMLILSCLPDGLFSSTWTREGKEDAIYNSTKAIYFKSLKMLLAHISI